MPMTPFIGVRISWLMLARNCDLARLASSACRARRQGVLLGLLEIVGSLLDLLLEMPLIALDLAPVLAEPSDHDFERAGEVSEFVVGPDLDRIVELAGGDGPGGADEGPDRRGDVADEKHGGDDAEKHDDGGRDVRLQQEPAPSQPRLVLAEAQLNEAEHGGGRARGGIEEQPGRVLFLRAHAPGPRNPDSALRNGPAPSSAHVAFVP